MEKILRDFIQRGWLEPWPLRMGLSLLRRPQGRLPVSGDSWSTTAA